jgi:hypothetical protein
VSRTSFNRRTAPPLTPSLSPRRECLKRAQSQTLKIEGGPLELSVHASRNGLDPEATLCRWPLPPHSILLTRDSRGPSLPDLSIRRRQTTFRGAATYLAIIIDTPTRPSLSTASSQAFRSWDSNRTAGARVKFARTFFRARRPQPLPCPCPHWQHPQEKQKERRRFKHT